MDGARFRSRAVRRESRVEHFDASEVRRNFRRSQSHDFRNNVGGCPLRVVFSELGAALFSSRSNEWDLCDVRRQAMVGKPFCNEQRSFENRSEFEHNE